MRQKILFLIFCELIGFLKAYSIKPISVSFSATKNIEIKTGNSTMIISPFGGRIISYRLGEVEMLTQASEHENFGSTLWTAPQSDWGWPPFAVLDEKEYKVQEKEGVVTMVSQPDAKSGFQMTKIWKVKNNQSIEIEYQIKNISETNKSVGAWEVTRVPCGGLAFFPDGVEGKVPESNLKIDLRKDGINWVSIDKKQIEDHQKLFSTAQKGWLAYSLNGLLFVKQFQDTNPENYSPQQGEVEIYVNKEKSYAELENHGPYQVLKSGESLSYKVVWMLLPIPKQIENIAKNKGLSDLVRQNINE